MNCINVIFFTNSIHFCGDKTSHSSVYVPLLLATFATVLDLSAAFSTQKKPQTHFEAGTVSRKDTNMKDSRRVVAPQDKHTLNIVFFRGETLDVVAQKKGSQTPAAGRRCVCMENASPSPSDWQDTSRKDISAWCADSPLLPPSPEFPDFVCRIASPLLM